MNINQVAVILYTLRDYVKTPEDLQSTLEKIARIGYRAVQISGVPEGVLPPADIADRCRDLGLTICATHESGDSLFNNPDAVIEKLKALGTRHTAYPFPAGIDFTSTDSVDHFLKSLTRAHETLAQDGITLCYHNHSDEFRKLDGKTIYQRIFEETPLSAELDTYWVQAGGASPLGWVQCLAGKIPLLHLKDMAIGPEREQHYAPIGSGNIQFSPIIQAAETGGCQWFIVEQDECYDLDPFDAVQRSFEYIRDHLCQSD